MDRDVNSVSVISHLFTIDSETTVIPLPSTSTSPLPVISLDDQRNGSLGSYQKMGREVPRPSAS